MTGRAGQVATDWGSNVAGGNRRKYSSEVQQPRARRPISMGPSYGRPLSCERGVTAPRRTVRYLGVSTHMPGTDDSRPGRGRR